MQRIRSLTTIRTHSGKLHGFQAQSAQDTLSTLWAGREHAGSLTSRRTFPSLLRSNKVMAITPAGLSLAAPSVVGTYPAE